MVYVAYGALLASIPVLVYACTHYEWRSKFYNVRLTEAHSPPDIGITKPDEDEQAVVLRKQYESPTQSHPGPAIQEPNTKDAAFGTPEGRKPEMLDAPRGGAPVVAAPTSNSDPSNTDSVETEKSVRGMEQSKSTMKPPPRPGPRLRPKANDQVRRPSSSQSSSSSLRVPPTVSSTLRPPPSAASNPRIPPTRSPAPLAASTSLTASTLPSSKQHSKKVLLEPGHSPLDWANLIHNPPSSTYLRGDDVSPNLIRVPPSLLRYHNGRKGKNAWGVWQGKVYNLTPYMKFHPGGVNELMKGAGREKDAERLFLEVHPWVNWEGLLGECLVGILVSEDDVHAAEKGESNLDDMD